MSVLPPGTGLVLLVLLGIAAVTLVRLQGTAAVEDRLSREDTPALQAIDDLRVQIVNEQIAVTRFEGSMDSFPHGNEDLLPPYFRAHDDIVGDLAALARLEGDTGSAELTSTLTQLRSQIQVVEAESAREIAAIRSGAPVGGDTAAELAQIDTVRATAATVADTVGLQIRIAAADAQRSASDSTKLVIVASLLEAGISLAVAIVVTLSISAPLRRLRASADRIAAGELVEPGFIDVMKSAAC